MPVPGTKPISIGKILVSPLHLVGVVVLLMAVILHIGAMFSPAWSYWQGVLYDNDRGIEATRERKDNPVDDLYAYNGPWMRTMCSYEDYKNAKDSSYERDEIEDAKNRPRSSSYGLWALGTRGCKQSVHLDDYCVDYYGIDKQPFDKCGHLSAVRALTCIAMVLGLLAFLLSVAGVISVGGPKYPCIGSCLLALIAGVCIFIAICIWASIKNWEKEEMRIRCSNHDSKWDTPNDDKNPDVYDCWGKTGSYPAGPDKDDKDDPCNDECDKIDPPYGLGYAYVLCIIAMGLFAIGGVLNGAAGLNKRIPSK